MPRTKGAKNKVTAEFDRKFDRICRRERTDIVEMMICVAAGTDTSEDWTKQDRLYAAGKLLDKRYPNKRENVGNPENVIPEQIKIVYDDSNRDKPVLAPVSTVGTKG